MELVVGKVQHCHWQCLRGAVTPAGWQAYVDHLLGLQTRLLHGDLIVDLWHGCGLPPAEQRARFVEGFRNMNGLERIRAHVFVTDSALSRGVLTGVNWIIRRPFEERVFATPEAGLAWIARAAPDVDVAAIRRDMRAQIAGYDDIRW